MDITRTEIATLIAKRLEEEKVDLQSQFSKSKDQIGFFYIDDLLPQNLVEIVYQCFPKPEDSVLKKSFKRV